MPQKGDDACHGYIHENSFICVLLACMKLSKLSHNRDNRLPCVKHVPSKNISKIVSDNNEEIQQSQTACKPVAS